MTIGRVNVFRFQVIGDVLLENGDFVHALFGSGDLGGKGVSALLDACYGFGEGFEIVDAGVAVLLIVEEGFRLLLGDLILNGEIVIMTAPLILPGFQFADQLCILIGDGITLLSWCMNSLSGQNCANCGFLVFLRQRPHSDFLFLTQMTECDVLAAFNRVTGLFHQRQERFKIVRMFGDGFIHIAAKLTAVGELFALTGILQPAIVALATPCGIFDYG